MPPRKTKSKQESLPAKQKPIIEPTRCRSTRGQTTNTVLTKKSPYFEHPSGDEDEDEYEGEEISEHRRKSEFESKHDTAASLSKRCGDTVERDTRPEKRRRSSTNPDPSSRAKKSKRSGEIFIPIRQPSPGDTEYQGHMIHPNTLDFLKGLLYSLRIAWSTAWET